MSAFNSRSRRPDGLDENASQRTSASTGKDKSILFSANNRTELVRAFTRNLSKGHGEVCHGEAFIHAIVAKDGAETGQIHTLSRWRQLRAFHCYYPWGHVN